MPATRTCYEIAPEDEMYRFLRTLGRREDQLFCEYMRTGFGTYIQIREILRRLGRDLSTTEAMLDFAAGYGRVVRFLLRDLPPERITVADIYRKAVAFQVDRLGVAGVVSRADPAELELPRSFDLITSISLFSHLPAELFRRWLERLTASLSETGLFLFTTQAPELLETACGKDYTFVPESESDSLPSSIYGSTFVSRDFVESLIAEVAPNHRLLAFLPRTLNEHQDVYVLGPQTEVEIAFEDLTLPQAYLDALQREGDEVRFMGWGLSTSDEMPAHSVRAFVDDSLVCEGRTGVERHDVAEMFGAGTRRSGFDLSFTWREEMSRGVFSAEVVDHRGLRSRLFHKLPF